LPRANICSKHLFMARPEREDTRERVLAAAAELFAERGFRGATMRAIAGRAGTNLASAHYHFGSKQRLYREVAFSMFLDLEARLEERGLQLAPAELAGRSREELEELLRGRIEILLQAMLAPPGLHGTLVLRELCDPSPALAEIVGRFIEPMRRQVVDIVRALEPALSETAAERCAHSIAGQVFFYRTHRAALLQMAGRRAYPRGFEKEVADHVLAFSLGGLARMRGAGAGGRGRGAR
jgi:AcrR family transcriptional regulator